MTRSDTLDQTPPQICDQNCLHNTWMGPCPIVKLFFLNFQNDIKDKTYTLYGQIMKQLHLQLHLRLQLHWALEGYKIVIKHLVEFNIN